MEEKKYYKKKKFNPNFKKKEEEKFDVEKWLKQHQNPEPIKRGKKNTLDKKRRKK